MIGKIIAFQKMMYLMVFSFDTPKNYKNKKYRTDAIILLIFTMLTYFIGIFIFGGVIGLLALTLTMLQSLFYLLRINENFVFNLPLKRSLLILNIYLYSICVTSICGLTFPILITIFSIYSSLIAFVLGYGYPNISDFQIVFIQQLLLVFLYIMVYINIIMISFFAKKSIIRNTIIIVFSSIYCSVALYIYSFLPKDPTQDYFSFSLTNSLLLVPNLWTYIALVFCVTLVVTIAGIFISIKLDGPKRKVYAPYL